MLIEAEIWTVARTDQGNVILIRPMGADVAVPVFLGQLETQSILIGLGQVPLPRPLSHDLMLTLMTQASQVLDRVEIVDLQEGTFFAQLIITTPAGTTTIDSRPSDALGLAVRAKVPIYIEREIVDEAALPLTILEDEHRDTREDPRELEIFQLERELHEEVERENYEKAAEIRDRLRELETKRPRGAF